MFVNETSSVGILLIASVNNVTGSLFLSLLILILGLIILCAMFRMPMELSAVVVFPLLFNAAAYYSEMIPIFGVFILYLAAIFTKWFFIK